MSHPVSALIGGVALLLFAQGATRRLALPTWPARVAGFFVLAFANVVIAAQILGITGLLRPQWFAMFHVLTAATAAWLWRNLTAAPSTTAILSWERLIPTIRRHPALCVFAVVVAFAYAVNLALAIWLPPNNWDSMMYHLSRVAYWLQQASFYPPWNPDHFMQMFHPINAEIGPLWTMVFWGSDRIAGAVQWLAALMIMIVIAGLARLLGFGAAGATFAALMWASLPEVMLQSTTTQSDLITSAFVLTAAYGCALGFLHHHRGALIVSGIAIGLAVGTKTTGIIVLPIIAVGAMVIWFRSGADRTLATTWIAASAIAICLLGAHTYVANFVLAGHPLGSAEYRGRYTNAAPFDPAVIAANTFRIGYGLVDLGGLPDAVAGRLLPVKVAIGHGIAQRFGIDPNRDVGFGPALGIFAFDQPAHLHEDLSFFGPLGFLFVLPVALWQGMQRARRGSGLALLLIGTAVWFVLTMAVGVRWHPWLGRYLVVAVTFCAPLLAGFYRPQRVGVLFLVALAAMVAVRTVLFNEAKPLSGAQSIWERDRIGVRALTRPPIEPLLRIIEREVGDTARVGLILKHNDWDYPVFGQRLRRTLIPLWPKPTVLTEDVFSTHNLDFVLTTSELPTDTTAIAQQFRSWTVAPWTLIARQRIGE